MSSKFKHCWKTKYTDCNKFKELNQEEFLKKRRKKKKKQVEQFQSQTGNDRNPESRQKIKQIGAWTFLIQGTVWQEYLLYFRKKIQKIE